MKEKYRVALWPLKSWYSIRPTATRRGFAVRCCLGGFRRGKWQAQIVGQTICRAQRNNRQGGFGADDSLQHIVNRAVAAAGEHGIAAFSDCSFGLLGRIGGGTCGCRRGFDSAILQNGEC